MRPPPTEFDRQYTEQRPSIDLARRYLEKEGFTRLQRALAKDVGQGKLPAEEAAGAVRYALLPLIERVAERVGHTRYVELLKDPELKESLLFALDDISLRRGINAPEAREQLRQTTLQTTLRYWHLVVHEQRGRQRYEITTDLARRLLNETFPEQPCDALKLPVDSLVLVVPEELGLVGRGPGGGVAPITEIYAVEGPAPEGRYWYLWLNMREPSGTSAFSLANVYLAPGATLAEAIAFTRNEGGPGQDPSWELGCRLLAGAARYLAEGGHTREEWYDETARELHEKLAATPKTNKKEREKLRERFHAVSPGRRIILEEAPKS
ncbi:hypothetical protein HPC49_45215 [Pyxidicoccus fallax]|uniref:Uncharacterized protein n=1 Tax=Pyxidicoccus fallax TaxID=394095 RepID=A0A848L9V8_9BACT|nr:hypothetical protein [Pyxidicoccus fallax]NMO15830.1 hypothetical protein [Pyxidicoccus fallax]NPC85382.1 hypothetical protein [Pyxidicoccus fallax]